MLGEWVTGMYASRSFCGQSLFAITLDVDVDLTLFNESEWLQANVLLDCLPATAKCHVEVVRLPASTCQRCRSWLYKRMIVSLFVGAHPLETSTCIMYTEQSQAFLRLRQEDIWTWTTWRITTWRKRPFEGLRGTLVFHLVSPSLQISLVVLPGCCLASVWVLCVWGFLCLFGCVGVVFVLCFDTREIFKAVFTISSSLPTMSSTSPALQEKKNHLFPRHRNHCNFQRVNLPLLMRVSLGFPSKGSGFPRVLQGFFVGFPSQGLGFPHVFARVSLAFPSKGLCFPHVLQGFPSKGSGFPHVLQGFPSGFLFRV